MSVMEKIRGSTDSTVMRVVFVLIVLVFVFWGVGTGAGMQSTQAIAQVNGERITDTELQRVMRTRVRDIGGGTMDEDQVNALSKQVLEELITDRVLVQESLRVGLEVSTEEMQRYILEIDAFKDDKGEFSSELYGRTLKRMGLTKGRFEEQIREEMLRNKLREVVVASVSVSEAEVRDLYERTATQAELRFVRLSDAELAAGLTVPEADVDAYLAASADKVSAAYEADKARLYSQPRRIGFHRILLRKEVAGVSDADLRARMDEIKAQATTGADFAELARRWSEDLSAENGGDAGLVPEPVMEPQLAAAALAAGAGKISDVIETDRGLVLLRVDQVLEASETPLDEVKRDIARNLIAKERAAALATERADKLLAAWKEAGAPPEAMIAELGLELRTSGRFSPQESFLPGIGVASTLAQAVSDKGGAGVLDGVYPVEGGRIVAEVSAWSGADAAQFEMLKDLVRVQLLQEKQQVVLEQWQQDLVSRARVERLMRQ